MKALILSAAVLLLTPTSWVIAAQTKGSLETVAELPIRPGNVSVTRDGRVFATVHPLDTPSGLQLIEINRSTGQFTAWPSEQLQKTGSANDAQFDTLLGITQDGDKHLWVVDMGLELGQTRIWVFPLQTAACTGKSHYLRRWRHAVVLSRIWLPIQRQAGYIWPISPTRACWQFG